MGKSYPLGEDLGGASIRLLNNYYDNQATIYIYRE